jgi:hypothetical protein
MKNSGDRLAVHPVLHIYVHCVLYENENDQASSKISSCINISYDRQIVTTPPLQRSNFVDVMEARSKQLFFFYNMVLSESCSRVTLLIFAMGFQTWL